jgi:ADP-ribosylglycohydrolase
MILNRTEYRDKLLGCWLGKNIGGTLGAPFEWRRQVNDVSFYTQDLGGEPLPNDDLDIQLLWLVALEERGIDLSARTLAEYWCLYLTPHWAEYGTAKINMRAGLPPPLSGTMHNVYKDSCGAFIRSEIWACIAPGLPDVAVRYACEDAILDHGNGEGAYGEIFMAALESAAFVIKDLRTLVEIGLSHIPADCGVARAVHTACECFDAGKTWRETRDEILKRHRGSSFANSPDRTSPEDRAKGFHEGQVGYDAPSNVALTVLGLLYGGDNFARMICTTVNCGEDTDCTAATAGAIFGILHGAGGIPQNWIAPIGRAIKTETLNLGELGHGRRLPQTVDEMTDRTERMAQQVLLRERRITLSDASPSDLSGVKPDALKSGDHGSSLAEVLNGPRFAFDFFTVCVDYGDAPVVRSGEPKTVRVTIHNTYKVQANLSLHWHLPEGWRVLPAADGFAMSLPFNANRTMTLEFQMVADRVVRAMNRAVFEITIEGRPTAMLIPITLLNGNVAPIERKECSS